MYRLKIRMAQSGGEDLFDDYDEQTGETQTEKIYGAYVDSVWDIVGEQPPAGVPRRSSLPGGWGSARAAAAAGAGSSTMNLSGWAAQVMGIPAAKFNYEKWITTSGNASAVGRKVTGDMSFLSQYY